MATHDSLLPSALDPFTDDEQHLFDELAKDAELEAIVGALFPWGRDDRPLRLA
jgi:hypothetical protein